MLVETKAEARLAEMGAFLLGMLAPALAGYLVYKAAKEQAERCPRCSTGVATGTSPCPGCGIGLRWG